MVGIAACKCGYSAFMTKKSYRDKVVCVIRCSKSPKVHYAFGGNEQTVKRKWEKRNIKTYGD